MISSVRPRLPALASCQTAVVPLATGGAAEFAAAYELLEELGRGTFGVVQRARHLATGQLRAVKRMRRRPTDIKPAVQSVEPAVATVPIAAAVEVEALANLDHQNVVGFYEYYATAEELLVVQELCEGKALEAVLDLALGRGLGVGPESATVLRQMLEAVQHCHERGFVHRDLKADNFVFAAGGPDANGSLKLIDFGMALRCGHNERLSGHAGTVDYSAPESLSDGAGFGLPADIWAVGAIFFLLLTGEPLVKTDGPSSASEEARQMAQRQAARKVLDARYIRLRVASAASRIPTEAADLLEGLLRRDPARRMTAEEALRHPWILANAPRGKAAADGGPRA